MTTVSWTENGVERRAGWRPENGATPPRDMVVVDDDIAADAALTLARSGTGILWRGDFHNARQLHAALDRRLQKQADKQAAKRASRTSSDASLTDLFHVTRLARSQRAGILGKILLELEPDYTIRLRRAPDVRAACEHAYGSSDADGSPVADVSGESVLVSLPELLGVISAYEWHQTGIEVAALGDRIHPAYGVFAPTRDEYLDLVADAAWPDGVDRPTVMDLGTGTGVLAAILARRGARRVVATDINPRAVRCARDNVDRLGLADRVVVEQADLWPAGDERADVVVCNPPWIPGRPTSALEQGIYDPKSDVLHRYLAGLANRLTPGGEGWLILSDLAELLGLRTREELLRRISEAGLVVVDTIDTAARHSRAADDTDPLHAARSRERTSLWRLRAG
ncbi:MAG: class I SAM-dependent methyltransferase [Actinomycetales bacterium]|nr:class I SAM-dependent methyltransferase [Actinomycetales bacterium]